MGAENRHAPYTNRNPGGQVPALELDNGRLLAETAAIFEYLDEKYPNPALIGLLRDRLRRERRPAARYR